MTERTLAAFRYVCGAEPSIHAIFITFGPSRVDQRIVDIETKAHAIVSSTCASNPSPETIGAALAAVTQAFADVTSASEHAKKTARLQGVRIR